MDSCWWHLVLCMFGSSSHLCLWDTHSGLLNRAAIPAGARWALHPPVSSMAVALSLVPRPWESWGLRGEERPGLAMGHQHVSLVAHWVAHWGKPGASVPETGLTSESPEASL